MNTRPPSCAARAPRWTLAGLAALVALSAQPLAAQERAVVVVTGIDNVSSVREPLSGALNARGSTLVAPDAVEAAMAFALGGEPVTETNAPQLREALRASALYLVSVRPAEGGEWFFSLQRFAASGVTSGFGRAESGAIASAVVQQYLGMDVPAPAQGAPAQGAPAQGAPAQGVPAQGAPAQGVPAQGGQVQYGPQGQPSPHAAYGQPQYPRQQPQYPQQQYAQAEPRYAERGYGRRGQGRRGYGQPRYREPAKESAFTTPAGLGLALGLAGWLFTPLLGGLLICDSVPGRNCGDAIGLGFIPIAGSWIVWANPPGLFWNEEEAVFFVSMGVAQAIGFPLGILFLVLAGADNPGRERAATTRFVGSLRVSPMEVRGGSGLAISGAF